MPAMDHEELEPYIRPDFRLLDELEPIGSMSVYT